MEKDQKIVDTFWENFNASRCKTAMLILSFIIILAFSLCEIFGNSSVPLYVLSGVVFGFWTGRHSKDKDKHISFNDYQLIKKNEQSKMRS